MLPERYSAFNVQLRLPTSHCSVYIKRSQHAATVSIKISAVLWDWRCHKGKFLRSTLCKYFLVSLWLTTILRTLKSQLNNSGKEKRMFAGWQLHWQLTV
jgi:hypothetical protein